LVISNNLQMKIDKNTYYYLIGIWFISILLIEIGHWYGLLQFGYGLGDIFYIGTIGLAVLIIAIFFAWDYFKQGLNLALD